MKNQIIANVYSGNSFAGYLAETPDGEILFGYDADAVDQDGRFHAQEDGLPSHTGYSLYQFPDLESGLKFIADHGYR